MGGAPASGRPGGSGFAKGQEELSRGCPRGAPGAPRFAGDLLERAGPGEIWGARLLKHLGGCDSGNTQSRGSPARSRPGPGPGQPRGRRPGEERGRPGRAAGAQDPRGRAGAAPGPSAPPGEHPELAGKDALGAQGCLYFLVHKAFLMKGYQ